MAVWPALLWASMLPRAGAAAGLPDATAAMGAGLAAGVSAAAPAALRSERLADFRDADAWQVSASDQVQARTRRDADGSLCLDVDFSGVSGYAVMRRERPVDWPADFDLGLRLKGSGAVNDVQLKFVDASGDNVWWVNRPHAALPGRLIDWRLRPRHLGFAWGPTTDQRLRRTQFIELVVAAGREGGRSTLCVAALDLRERAPEPADPPPLKERRMADALWIDAGFAREFNGLLLDWPVARDRRLAYVIETSDDGTRWQPLDAVQGSDGGTDALWLPDAQARWLRVRRTAGAGLPRLTWRTPAQWPDRHALLADLAAGLPRGEVPRSFLGQQHYWTLVGVDGGGARSGLIGEDGAIELGRAGPSIEPRVQLADGSTVTWAQAGATQSLREGYLPQPRVQWTHPRVGLAIDTAADGPAGSPTLLARYTLHNPTAQTQTLHLVLTLRPWQVNPPQQQLTTPGGIAPVRRLRWDAAQLAIDGRGQVVFTAAPARATAWAFDSGLALDDRLDTGSARAVDDPSALASAAGRWTVTLAPGAQARVGWAFSLGPEPTAAERASASAASAERPAGPQALRAAKKPAARRTAAALLTPAELDTRIDRAAEPWRERLSRLTLQLPTEGRALVETLRSAQAQMLMSRAGPALRPGTRAYARTWIRDGAMMVGALLRLGEADAARDFVDDFGRYLFDSGKVPCCVDHRGADPVAENDSHGQYLFAVAEVWRHTRDRAFLERHAARVARVVDYQDRLRQSTRTEAHRAPGRSHLFGLLPPSISHEGYFDKPAYSYWDNFWGLRGLRDAVLLAEALGQAGDAERWRRMADAFEYELAGSIEASARHHGLTVIAGAADRGDFDATSTSVALSPAQVRVPEALLRQTFARYADEARARAAGTRPWTDYTPYEWRNVGALLRLDRGADVVMLTDFLMGHRRPAGWNQWAEVVLPDARQPRFLGDMPHAWVASDFARAAIDLFAYERDAQRQLVLGAGLRGSWMRAGDIAIDGLSTAFGPLSWRLQRVNGGWRLHLPARPVGAASWVWRWPDDLPLPDVRHGSRSLVWSAARELVLPDGPAVLELVNALTPSAPLPR